MKCSNIILCFILRLLWSLSNAQTRYACLQGGPGGPGGPGGFFSSGQSDDDSHSAEDLMSSSSTMTGTLGCDDIPGTRILVSKVIHGRGGPFASCGSPNEFCDDVIYSNSRLSVMCNRKIRCFPSTTSKMIPQCGTSSNFVHVEYECVNPWSVFDICHDSTTNVQLSNLFIMSPKTASGASTCECIIKGKANGQVILDYVQSNTDPAHCATNYLLVESKSMGNNQTAVNKQNNHCGRKTITKDTYEGSVRLTYGTKSPFFNNGFLSKITVPNGATHEVSVQCGAVFSEQDQQVSPQAGAPDPIYRQMGGYYNNPFNDMAAYNRFLTTVSPFQDPYYGNTNSTQPGSGRNAARATWPDHAQNRHRRPYWDRGYYGGRQRFGPRPYSPYGPAPVRGVNATGPGGSNQTSPQVPPPPYNRRYYPPPTPFWRFMRQRRNRNLDLFADGPMFQRWGGYQRPPPMGRWPQNKGPPSRGPKPPVNGTKAAKLPSDVEFIGNTASRNVAEAANKEGQNTPPHAPQAHVSDDDDNDNKFPTEAGRLAAYIVGGTGAVLSAVGGVVMVMLCSRRRRRRNSEESDDASQRNVGPIYSLPTHNLGRVHVNAAYVSSDGEGSEAGWSELDLEDPSDPYSTAYTPSRGAREDKNATGSGSGSRQKAADLSAGTVLGISNLACPAAGASSREDEKRIYDNNI